MRKILTVLDDEAIPIFRQRGQSTVRGGDLSVMMIDQGLTCSPTGK